MPKQCPLKMAAAINVNDSRTAGELTRAGDCLCNEAACGWWSEYDDRCAPLALNGTIRDQLYEMIAVINRK